MRASSGPYIAADVVRACAGTLLCGSPETAFAAISTDSRDITAGDLFVPLKGDSFDGHDFALPALEAGARGCLWSGDDTRENLKRFPNIVLIQVQDTLRSLSDLASAHRSKSHVPLIAVTGSSGKTTVKEMIASAVGRSHRPLVSKGNLNNMIGLPMTVLNLGPHHTLAVVEAGINTNGEMEHLARAALPDVAVITTIGPVHLEGLGTIENVAAEKFKLVRALADSGTAVLPHGNSYLESLTREVSCKIVRFGIESGDFRAEDIVSLSERTVFQLRSPGGKAEISLRVRGKHNISNALAAAAAAYAVGVTPDDIAEALSNFAPPALRMEIVQLSGGRILIRDCYNANPQSVRAALEVLASRPNHGKLALLADMKELGSQSELLHSQIGEETARLGIDRIIFIGSFGQAFASGFQAAGGSADRLILAGDKDEAWSIIGSDIKQFGSILVKGSRAMKMETMADRILEAQ
ncbi:UDP-N-acetylmuramoyl-tripeptide--D-alanyl-D-alanine ligase [Desulfomonile tiedjei]|uniref:UDP-N-acetylmuramoyl-tripeptide--D-alanyl-D-alanine ligase n=1 Tax=Desulfomonile tiedjei (strain ATCC 49306 / DSM 6799 / DCB-1) TaxID=706587 RepID=I4CCN4_DESTA|nr:UDP-N-acetylmuramoyl-tripeptide--D-alanyl-D-alanine ligase [Desulfomonile tiedjei]AFM27325.1 UDP-N-acetylmuramoyl-tripeptide--D-alanyl-D-alanine ligase [Desulfomonile tiedjei DSM 6799]